MVDTQSLSLCAERRGSSSLPLGIKYGVGSEAFDDYILIAGKTRTESRRVPACLYIITNKLRVEVEVGRAGVEARLYF